MTYLIYARVSPKGSTWSGTETSIGVQVEECRRHIAAQDPAPEILTITDEFWSGKDTKRPGIREALAQLASGHAAWDCLVVYSLDRFTRSLADALPMFEALHRNGKGFISVRQRIDMFSAGGRAMLYMMCVFAQLEREMTSERTKAKMVAICRAGGIPYGHPPRGYRRTEGSNIPQIDPEGAAVVKDIFASYISGATVPDIARRYSMHPQTVTKTLRNRLYLGTIEYDGQQYPGKHKPILDQATWDAANRRLPGARRGAGRPAARTYDYLLAGMIHCACGRHMTPYSVLKRNGTGAHRYHYYKCTDHTCGNAVSARAIDASEAVALVPQRTASLDHARSRA